MTPQNQVGGASNYIMNIKEGLQRLAKVNNDDFRLITPYNFVSKKKIGFLQYSNAIRKLVKKDFFVHSNSGAGFLLNKIDLETVHHIPPIFKDHFIHALPALYSTYKANELIAVSEFTSKQIGESIFRSKNHTIIHNGIDTNFFKNNDIKSNTPKSNRYKTAIFVGNLVNRKQPWLLLDWLLVNKDFRLIIFGEGPLKIPLSIWTKKLKLNNRVNFMSGDNHKLRNMLWESDIFISPSEMEGFGIALIEAVASGLPFLSFETGISPKLAKIGLGATVKNIETFRNFDINELISNFDKEDAWSHINQNYSIDNCVNKTYELYKKFDV